MAIEFHCPNGHILEVDDEHAGVQIRCPACDVKCLVPPRQAPAPAAAPRPPTPPDEDTVPLISPRKVRRQPSGRRRSVATRKQPLDVEVPEVLHQPVINEPATPAVDVGEGIGAANRKTLHIECKKCSQLLEVSSDMFGQKLACPACGNAFLAELTRTVEYRREKQIKDDKQERQLSTRWLYTAVFVGVFTVIGLVILIAWSASK